MHLLLGVTEEAKLDSVLCDNKILHKQNNSTNTNDS
jgi:hypothetical protein